MTSQATKQDVIDLLIQQHQQLKGMFRDFASAPKGERRERFEDIVRLLAVHESAEELVVHPAARDTSDALRAVVERRLVEEKDAKQMLAELYEIGPDNPDFDAKFATLVNAVTVHASEEESEEFPALRDNVPEERRERMARMLRAAEKMAPTRAHPRTGESAAANLFAGPPLAVFDRVRDAMRDMRERER